jgi:pimeloyl-ACP methyl ester carboxylesterase
VTQRSPIPTTVDGSCRDVKATLLTDGRAARGGMHMRERRRWRLLSFVAALVIIVGQASQSIGQVASVRPALGALIDIGQRRMHLYCTGSASPTVILESGASSFALDWALVQADVARTTRVCSYDRAGYAWSDPTQAGEAPQQVVRDLRTLLDAAHERPPFVLVGASMGGIYVRMFQLQYPSDVSGMVFIDPSHEDRLFVDVEGKTIPIWARTVEQVRASLPPRSAWPALLARLSPRSPQTGSPFDRLPRDLYEARVEFEKRLIASGMAITYDQFVDTEVGRQSAFVALHEQAAAVPHPLGNRPVVVLTRSAGASQGLIDVHAALAMQSTNSRHTVVAGAGHEIHLYAPAAVIQAVKDVVEASRRSSSLPVR